MTRTAITVSRSASSRNLLIAVQFVDVKSSGSLVSDGMFPFLNNMASDTIQIEMNALGGTIEFSGNHDASADITVEDNVWVDGLILSLTALATPWRPRRMMKGRRTLVPFCVDNDEEPLS